VRGASATAPAWALARALVLVAALPLVGACAVGVGYGGYDDDYPPDTYIATTQPYYYEGRPTYWYGGRWYYRDGGAWRHYDREPPVLYERRAQAAPLRRNFEPQRRGWVGSPPGRTPPGVRRGRP